MAMAVVLGRACRSVLEPTINILTCPPATSVLALGMATTAKEAEEGNTGGLRDQPGHELATGGLYDSSRKDRDPLPDRWLGSTAVKPDQVSEQAAHEDPSASNQHPSQAFAPPSQGNPKETENASLGE